MTSAASILLVDDNEQIRTMVRAALHISNDEYTIYEAGNGDEAIALLEQEDGIDIVILDLQMPITDGWEALRIIKDEDNGWPETKVIMLTVQKEAENALKAWSIGADFFVSKPFKLNTLLGTVEKALGEETSAPLKDS